MSRSVFNTYRGLRYRYIGPRRYECTRCRGIVDGEWGGWNHVCMPAVNARELLADGVDINAHISQQYEALSLLFAKLAVEAEREAREIAAERDDRARKARSGV